MKIEKYLNLERIAAARFPHPLLSALSIASIEFALVLVFLVVPNEKIMGAVQRIFYFHVASAMNAYLMIGILLFASTFYLVTKKHTWDLLAAGSAEIGFVLCSIVLATGMIWGHSAWNTWWRWEPRLVSFLVLWFILFSYVVFRSASNGMPQRARYCSVIGILAALNVPIVIFSIKLLDHSEQLHPEVVADKGLGDVRFVYAFITSTVAVMFLSFWMLAARARQQVLAWHVAEHEQARQQ